MTSPHTEGHAGVAASRSLSQPSLGLGHRPWFPP